MNTPMALTDYLPVAFFLTAAILLQRDLYHQMSKGAFALFSAGTITVFVAGFFKATWKLLYALGICDYAILNSCFFPMQATGFVLAAAGILALLFHNQGHSAAYAAVPAVYHGKLIFVAMTVLGVAVLDGGLLVISLRRKCSPAAALFAASFVFVMGMGYLSAKDFTVSWMNWLAECVNIAGQGLFMLGAIFLYKSGLGKGAAPK